MYYIEKLAHFGDVEQNFKLSQENLAKNPEDTNIKLLLEMSKLGMPSYTINYFDIEPRKGTATVGLKLTENDVFVDSSGVERQITATDIVAASPKIYVVKNGANQNADGVTLTAPSPSSITLNNVSAGNYVVSVKFDTLTNPLNFNFELKDKDITGSAAK
jgi:hypothetical protein